MKPFECEKESLVIEAARSGAWDADLRAHTSECTACSDAALAAQALNEMRAIDFAECRIPDAGLMWWKAQLLAKREAGERATGPIAFVERFAYACGLLTFAGACVWQWHAIRAWFSLLKLGSLNLASLNSGWQSLYESVAAVFTTSAQKSSSLPKFSLMIELSIGLLLLFVAFAAYFARSEE